MRCWSCSAEIAPAPFCPACQSLQPLPPGADRFQVMGLARSFFQDPKAMEERFRELNKRLHPDRFAQKSPKERRLSLEWTTALNDAWRSLKVPLRRAVYLLHLEGIEVESETGGSAMQRVPPEMLEEVMDLREALGEARFEKDLDRVRALVTDVKARKARVETQVSGLLNRWESARDRAALEEAGQTLAAGKYYERFLEEAEAIEMEALGG